MLGMGIQGTVTSSGSSQGSSGDSIATGGGNSQQGSMSMPAPSTTGPTGTGNFSIVTRIDFYFI